MNPVVYDAHADTGEQPVVTVKIGELDDETAGRVDQLPPSTD